MLTRTAAAAAAAIVLFSTPGWTQAVSPFPFWTGGAVIDSATSACANGGFVRARDFFVSEYRAKTGVAGEPNSPGITFLSLRSALAFFRSGGAANANTMHGSGNFTGFLIRGNVTTIPNPNQSTYPGTFTFQVNPTTITKTTDPVSINGTINKWRNIANCTVKFRAAYRLTK